MKKQNIFLAIILLLVFLLSACTQAQSENKSNYPFPDENSQKPVEEKNETPSQPEIVFEKSKVRSDEYWGFYEDINLLQARGELIYKEIDPCDTELFLSRYSADEYYNNKKLVEQSESDKALQREKGIYNNASIQVYFTDIEFELIETHLNDPNSLITLCTYDSTFCEKAKDWAIFKINGEEIRFAREEIRTIEFENNLTMNVMLKDGNFNLCLKFLE